MPIKIKISDNVLERTQRRHQLRLWGAMNSELDTNCYFPGCSQPVDLNKNPVYCECGEGIFCNEECMKEYFERDTGLVTCEDFQYCAISPDSDARPSPNHRRALIIRPEEGCNGELFWIEVQNDTLIIDHPVFDKYFDAVGTAENWLDIAVVNPGVHAGILGHGLAVGFPSATMRPGAQVDHSLVNKSILCISEGGYVCQWAGPLIFFAYGYDISGYVKVRRGKTGTVHHGAELGMSDVEIWDEIDQMRQRFRPYGGKPRQPDGEDVPLVWKWKVKNRGTSMSILDLTRRDYTMAVVYLFQSQYNPCPEIAKDGTVDYACKVSFLDHPGYQAMEISLSRDSSALLSEAPQLPAIPPGLPVQLRDMSFELMPFPVFPEPALPMVGAFAVGLRWFFHPQMQINPPFRKGLPQMQHRRAMSIMWGLKRGTGENLTPELELDPSVSSCDGLLVGHMCGTGAPPHHVLALLKYLDFTDPLLWSRYGDKGFERYWKVYAKLQSRAPDAHTHSLPVSPYKTDDEYSTALNEGHKGHIMISSGRMSEIALQFLMMSMPHMGGEARRDLLWEIREARMMEVAFTTKCE